MKDDAAKEDFEEADDLCDIDAIDDSLDNEETTPVPSDKTTSLALILDIPLQELCLSIVRVYIIMNCIYKHRILMSAIIVQ